MRLVIQRVAHAKVDIEGAEYHFWQGAERVRKDNPHLSFLMEFNAAKYERPEHFLDQMLASGYALESLGHDDIVQKRLLVQPKPASRFLVHIFPQTGRSVPSDQGVGLAWLEN